MRRLYKRQNEERKEASPLDYSGKVVLQGECRIPACNSEYRLEAGGNKHLFDRCSRTGFCPRCVVCIDNVLSGAKLLEPKSFYRFDCHGCYGFGVSADFPKGPRLCDDCVEKFKSKRRRI